MITRKRITFEDKLKLAKQAMSLDGIPGTRKLIILWKP